MTAVSVAFFGDGATGQGILYESMNLAALWGLPVIFACINNQYGMGTRIDQATANTRLHERAIAFGLNGESVDGTDVEEVHETARADRQRVPANRASSPFPATASMVMRARTSHPIATPPRKRPDACAIRWHCPCQADRARRLARRSRRARCRDRSRNGCNHRLHFSRRCRRSLPCSATSSTHPSLSPSPSVPASTRARRRMSSLS